MDPQDLDLTEQVDMAFTSPPYFNTAPQPTHGIDRGKVWLERAGQEK